MTPSGRLAAVPAALVLVLALATSACGPDEDECGDGRWGPLEACDPTYPGHEQVCSAQCLLLTCGDDRLVPDETCDDAPPRCGDGRPAHHELCPGAPVTFADAAGPVDVLLADLDGDARAELVIAWTTPPSLTVRRAGVDGLGAPETVPLPATPRRVVPAGVDPADDDLVVLLDGAQVTWARDAPGGWTVDTPIVLPAEGTGVAAHEGRAWVAAPGAGVLIVQGGVAEALDFTPAGAVDVAVGQFDGDSLLDLIAIDGADDGVGLILRSAESGAFEIEDAYPIASSPEAMRLGRFSYEAEPSPFIRGADGMLYASRALPADFVNPYATIGVGAPFVIVPSFDGGPGFGPTATVGADDAVAGSSTGVDVHLWTDPQTTGYLAPVAIALGGAVTAVAGGDVDGDGVPEIAAAIPSLDQVALVPMTP